MYKATFNKETKILSGQKIPSLYNPDQNLGQLICRVLEQTPDLITQISADTNVLVTCGEMRDRTLEFVRHLSESGYKQDDVIGIIAGNSENIAPAVFACFVLGLPINPLSPIMIESDIVQMFSKTKPKLIICDAKNVKIVQGAVNLMKSDAKIYTMMEKVNDYECISDIVKCICENDKFIYPVIDSNSTLLILQSSRSSKLICKSHKDVISSILPLCIKKFTQTPVVFAVPKLSCFIGYYSLIQTTLFKQKRVITTQSFDSKNYIDIMEVFRVNFMLTSPLTLEKFLQTDEIKTLKHMRCWLVTGSFLSRDIFEKFKSFIPNGILCNGYACIENNFIAINCENKNFPSVGRPNQNDDVKIIDEDGKALNCFAKGEICIRNPVQFNGYFNELEKTKEAFDDDAFFKTGDFGCLDDEGNLFVCGRE